MPRQKSNVPGYWIHKPTNRGCAEFNGKMIYFPGDYDSAESREAYDRQVAEWLSAGRKLPEPKATDDTITVSMLLAAFWRYAQTYYRDPDGKPTGEIDSLFLRRFSAKAILCWHLQN